VKGKQLSKMKNIKPMEKRIRYIAHSMGSTLKLSGVLKKK